MLELHINVFFSFIIIVDTNIYWNIIWKWKSFHRIQIFTRLMLHEIILTIYNCREWNPTIPIDCIRCIDTQKTLVFVLQDFPYVTQYELSLLLLTK